MWVTAATLLFLQAADYSAEGMKALESAKYEAAVEAFNKAIQADTKDYAAHFNLALAYSLLHQDAQGIAEYRKTLELKPGLYEAELNAGILLLRQKNPAEAAPLLEQAAAQKPQEFRPRFYLAEAQLQNGDPAKAEVSYETAIGLNPKSAAAQLGLARALAQQKKLDDAAPHFREAAKLDTSFGDALLELASLYEKQQRGGEAIAIYREFPGNPAAQERLGALLLESKQYADAVPRLEEAYAKDPTEANRVALAEAYLFSERNDKAQPLLAKAVAEAPNDFDLRMMYGRALRDQKQYAPALSQYAEAVKLKPDSLNAWSELGGMLYLTGDLPKSLEAFDKARELGQNTPGNWFMRAILLDKLRDLKPALAAYQQFLSLSAGQNPDQEFQARQRARIIQSELNRR
jgi:tetratricopeptide (TPR) repeat protein